MTTTLIADAEGNDLLPGLTRLYMVQVGNAFGDDAVLYVDFDHLPDDLRVPYADLGLSHEIRPISEGIARLKAADHYVFHNGLTYDMAAINRFYPGTIERHKLLDTLVMARLAEPDERDHTLRAHGRRLGVLKDDYKGGYEALNADFLRYSEQDVVVGRALFHKVRHVMGWGESCALEHEAAWAIHQQELNGFSLDVPGAETLAADLRGELEEITKGLTAVFPPLQRVVDFTPKVNNAARGYKKGVLFQKKSMEDFNPNSRRHCAERLKMAGWVPTVINDDGTPKLDEKILATLPYPEAKALQVFFTTNKMLGQLSDGKEGWLRHVKADGRVHGRVNPNGCCTGRMSHSKPNLGNVDKDPRMRSLWGPRAGMTLVGVDAEALEAVVLAHYLHTFDGGAYTNVVLTGSSRTRTDVHSSNLRAMIKQGLVPKAAWDDPVLFDKARGGAKGCLYAMAYGGQDPKLGSMVADLLKSIGVRPPALAARERGALFRKAIMTSMVGLDTLTNKVKERAKSRKFLIALDGRHLPVRSMHAALNTLLQGGGAVIMKKALCLFLESLTARGYVHGTDYGLVANVHDEFQTECRPEIAEEVRQLAEDSIRLAGAHFNLRCPLKGKAVIGSNWSETH